MNPLKFPWTLTLAVLIVTVSLARSQLFYHGRRLRIAPKECSSSSKRFESLSGVCMFNLECQEKLGTVIGACVDQFLFGACCHIPNYTPAIYEEENPSGEGVDESSTFPTFPTTINSEFIDANSSALNNLYNVSFDASATLQPMGNWNLSKFSVGAFTSTSELPNPESTSSAVTLITRHGEGPTGGGDLFSTRFQPRPTLAYGGGGVVSVTSSGVPPSPGEDEKVDALHSPDVLVSTGERPTSASPSLAGSFLPLALETFSSVSDPVANREHGNHPHVHNANGQSHVPVEPSPLTLVSRFANLSGTSSGGGGSFSENILKRTNVAKPYILTSSSFSGNNKFSSYSYRPAAAGVNSKFSYFPTTESPPKLSTFMYVDGDLPPADDYVTTNSITENSNRFPDGETTETDNVVTITEQLLIPVQDKVYSDSELNEDLNSNTENVWSVVMQLGPHTSDPSKPPEVSSGEADSDFSHLPIIASTLHTNTPSSSHLQNGVGPNALPLLASVLEAADADDDEPDMWRTTLTSVGKDVSQDLKDDVENDDDDSTESDGFTASTTKPWASSTYMIHTFQYPEHNQTYSSEEDSSETTLYTAAAEDISKKNGSTTASASNGLMTWLSVDLHNEVTTEKETPTQEPDMKEDDSAQEMLELAEGLKHSAIFSQEISSSTTTPRPTTPQITQTTTTTEATTTTRITTTKKPTKVPTTTTRRTTTSTTTTRPMPSSTSTKLPSRATTSKWKRPSQYTLPPEKKRTTTTTTTTTPEPETKRTTPIRRVAVVTTSTTTTTTPKPPKLLTKAPTLVTKSTTPILLAEEDIDTNLDYLVDQVVQNMAESLSGSDLDEVIKHPQILESSSAATIHPDQSLSDSKFPSFPILKDEHPSTKTKKPVKDKSATTKRPSTTTHRTLDYRKDCGVRTLKKSGRIVGGTASKFGQWPWQALVKEATWLGLFSKNKCGGVLIAPKYVLTAAHCQPGFLATLTVVLGDFDISSGKAKASSQSVTKNVRRVIVHRDYNAQTFENDIALLELESAVEYAPHIVPICLPEDTEDFVGKQAFVTGWGRLKYGGGVPQILHEVDVPVLTNDNCQEMFQKSGHLKAIRESFICAGYAEGLKDSCEGDSGGPLSVKRETGQWVLAGTVSHGIKCAYPNLPGVYMRMTFYKPWIKKVTGLKT